MLVKVLSLGVIRYKLSFGLKDTPLCKVLFSNFEEVEIFVRLHFKKTVQ